MSFSGPGVCYAQNKSLFLLDNVVFICAVPLKGVEPCNQLPISKSGMKSQNKKKIGTIRNHLEPAVMVSYTIILQLNSKYKGLFDYLHSCFMKFVVLWVYLESCHVLLQLAA